MLVTQFWAFHMATEAGYSSKKRTHQSNTHSSMERQTSFGNEYHTNILSSSNSNGVMCVFIVSIGIPSIMLTHNIYIYIYIL
mmetsp:Transcript_19929/g.19186  ORF Transcript_19929/g.19186 Transcript_19929/m.19186 type:complete len:82 (+) Transcript_19929:122-367(+)